VGVVVAGKKRDRDGQDGINDDECVLVQQVCSYYLHL